MAGSIDIDPTNKVTTVTITDNDSATWSLTGDSSVNEGRQCQLHPELGGSPPDRRNGDDQLGVDRPISDLRPRSPERWWMQSTPRSFPGQISPLMGRRSSLLAPAARWLRSRSPSYPLMMETQKAVNPSGCPSPLPGSATGATIAGTGSVTTTIVDNDTANVTISDVTEVEGVGMVFTATLNKATTGGFRLNVSTSVPGTATAGSDYTNVTNQQLVFTGLAGETKTFTVATTGDTTVEADETFSVKMTNLVMGNSLTPLVDISDTATGTIEDNDSAQITIGDVTVAEGGTATFSLILSHAVQGGFTVDVAALPGSAYLGDFNNVPRTITFTGTAGEVRTFTVATVNDNEVEPSEAFSVNMSNLVMGNSLIPTSLLDITRRGDWDDHGQRYRHRFHRRPRPERGGRRGHAVSSG